jgi:hypothetical protein
MGGLENLISTTMDEREGEEIKPSWGRRSPFIGSPKSNRYLQIPHNRYYRLGKK